MRLTHGFDAYHHAGVLQTEAERAYAGPIYDLRGTQLVGITGFKGHGKDAVAARLTAHDYERIAFADKLKNVAAQLWGLSEEQLYGTIAQKEAADPRWERSARHFLQVLGTEVVRHGHPETWIRGLLASVAAFPPASRWAIPDCRFPNEADAIRKHGGVVVRVVRPGFGTGVGEEHASERGVLAIRADYVIVNDGTLDDLHTTVDQFVVRLAEERRR